MSFVIHGRCSINAAHTRLTNVPTSNAPSELSVDERKEKEGTEGAGEELIAKERETFSRKTEGVALELKA